MAMSHHRYNDHHIIPSSRGGKRTVRLPEEFHGAWHILFQNMYGEEILLFIKDLQTLFQQKDKVSAREIHDLREEIKGCDLNG